MYEIGFCRDYKSPASIVVGPFNTQEEAIEAATHRNKVSRLDTDGCAWFFSGDSKMPKMEGCLYVTPDYTIKAGDVLLTPQDAGILWLVVRDYDDKPDLLLVPLTEFEVADVTDVKHYSNGFTARCNCAMFISKEYMQTIGVVADSWIDLTVKVRSVLHSLATGIDLGETTANVGEESEYSYHIREVQGVCDLHQNRSFSLDFAGE